MSRLAVNRCDSCGKFKSWADLKLHFVPDTSFSSEDESWRECKECRDWRPKQPEARVRPFEHWNGTVE